MLAHPQELERTGETREDSKRLAVHELIQQLTVSSFALRIDLEIGWPRFPVGGRN
jgi:hypothetical protein